jgi:hypothetical protein
MWSDAVNSLAGCVKDSYHRIAVMVDLNHMCPYAQVADEVFRAYAKYGGRMHLVISMKEDYAFSDIDRLQKALISKWNEHFEDRLDFVFVTVICPPEDVDNVLESQNFPKNGQIYQRKQFDINAIILDQCNDNLKVIDVINNTHQNHSENLILGISIAQDDLYLFNFEWILTRCSREAVKVVNVGSIADLPNLKTRCVDLIHSKGMNCFCNLGEELIMNPKSDKLQYLVEMQNKYDKSPISILAKSLLQLGYIVAIPFMELSAHHTVVKDLLLLAHPFVYRARYVEPTDVRSFIIHDVDMDTFKESSAEAEGGADEEQMDYARNREPARPLIDQPVPIFQMLAEEKERESTLKMK